MLFFLVGTYTNIPYDAVAPELTDNYEDRTNVFFFCTLFDGLGGLVAVGGPVGLTSLLSQEKSCDYSSCYNPASFVGSNQSVYGTVNTCARVVGDDLNQYIYTNETLFALKTQGVTSASGKRSAGQHSMVSKSQAR